MHLRTTWNGRCAACDNTRCNTAHIRRCGGDNQRDLWLRALLSGHCDPQNRPWSTIPLPQPPKWDCSRLLRPVVVLHFL